MRQIFLKKIATIVLLTFLFMVISQNYTFGRYGVVSIMSQIEQLYKEGYYGKALELIDEFVDEYSSHKEEYEEEFCFAYYIRAKVFFDIDDKKEMKKALLNLYHTNPNYILPLREDEKFINIANEIKRAVLLEMKLYKDKLKDEKLKDEKEKRKFPVTFEITNISDGVYICVDELNLDRAKPLKRNKLDLELEPGKHRVFFILKSKSKVLVKDYKITNTMHFQLPLNFAFGHDITNLLPSHSYSSQNVIEKPLYKKKKKKKLPTLLLVGAAVIIVGVLALLLTKKKNDGQQDNGKNEPPDNGEISIDVDPEEIKMIEGETKSFTVKLSDQPRQNVNIIVEIKDEENCSIQFKPQDETQTVPQKFLTLTFNENNYNMPQEVSIEALTDGDTEKGKATIQLRANRGDIEPKSIKVEVLDTGTGSEDNPSTVNLTSSSK